MKNKKIIFLLILGIIFLAAGFLIRKYPKENISALPGSTLGERSFEISKTIDAAKITIKISKVLDGDTVETETGEKIRYIGINAPETGEPFSKEATELNRQLVLGKPIGIEYDIQKKDRFRRTLAYVFVDNLLVNLELIKKGLALVKTIQPNIKYQDVFVGAQKEARKNCLGIWKSLCDQN